MWLFGSEIAKLVRGSNNWIACFFLICHVLWTKSRCCCCVICIHTDTHTYIYVGYNCYRKKPSHKLHYFHFSVLLKNLLFYMKIKKKKKQHLRLFISQTKFNLANIQSCLIGGLFTLRHVLNCAWEFWSSDLWQGVTPKQDFSQQLTPDFLTDLHHAVPAVMWTTLSIVNKHDGLFHIAGTDALSLHISVTCDNTVGWGVES